MSEPSEAGEERLDRIREEAARTGRVSAPGVRAAGGPLPTPEGRPEAGYYGRPVLKPPVWTWEIPLYFFVGGIAGGSGALALAARLASAPEALLEACLWIAVAGAVLSAGLLVSDLGRPARFLHMLRVFKWRSAMSVGVWVLTVFGGAASLALVMVLSGAGTGGPGSALLWAALATTAVTGSVVATYTGVLLAVTAVPAWSSHRGVLPIHFGVAALGSAAAVLELLGFGHPGLHLLGLGAAGVETLIGIWMELARHGPRDRALREGRPGLLLRTSGALAGPVSLVFRLVGWRLAAGIAFLLGALLSRYGWMAAGRASARDPEAALARPAA